MSRRGQVGKTLLMAGALLNLISAPAFPSGLELAWNACFGQPGAVGAIQSTCDSNTGSQTLIASFRPPAGVTRLEGIAVFVDFQLATSGLCPSLHDDPQVALPCWWNFATGQPRNDQLVSLHVSPTDANGNPEVRCDNHYFFDHGALGLGGMIGTDIGRGQFRGLAYIAAGTGLPVAQNVQQYGFGFRILNGSTLPVGTCGGCTANLCFMFNTIELYQPDAGMLVMHAPHPGSQNWASWRPLATPTLQHSWGQIKGIYR